MTMQARTTGSPVVRGFTLVELLAVVLIIIIGTALVVPAFGRIIESTRYASAINIVTTTLGKARALAIQNGRHTGVVFLFDTETETYSLLPVELLGSQGGFLTNQPTMSPDGAFAFVFKPAALSQPVELPKGTGVYGLSFDLSRGRETVETAGPTTPTWYAGDIIDEDIGDPTSGIIPWIFPRNDPRHFTAFIADTRTREDPWDPDSGASREVTRACATFFVLFNPAGGVTTRITVGGQETRDAFLEWPDLPINENAPEDGPLDDPTLFDPEVTPAGNRTGPNPEVMLRTVSQLAIVDFGRLEEGIRLADPWFVRPHDGLHGNVYPAQPEGVDPIYFDSGSPGDPGPAERIGTWIDRNAEILGFNRFTGNVTRRIQR